MDKFNRLFKSLDWAIMYGLTVTSWFFATVSRGYVTFGGELLIPALYILIKLMIKEFLEMRKEAKREERAVISRQRQPRKRGVRRG